MAAQRQQFAEPIKSSAIHARQQRKGQTLRIVGGKFSGRPIAAPAHAEIRPTTDRRRESLFNILSHQEDDFFVGKRVLDLFAGTGALGLEALSRGAANCVHVEISVEARALIQQNIEAFGLQGVARILRRDATQLGKIGSMKPFDLIFADPPYNKGLGERAFLSALMGGWLKENALLILEESVRASVKLAENFKLYDERHFGSTIISMYKLSDSLVDKS